MVKRIVCLYNQLAAKYENWKQNSSEDYFHVGLLFKSVQNSTRQIDDSTMLLLDITNSFN